MATYEERIAAHLQAMIEEVVPDLRNEIADAAAFAFGWEFWRLSQDPPVDDTPAARRLWARDEWAKVVKKQVAGWLKAYRRRTDDVETELDVEP